MVHPLILLVVSTIITTLYVLTHFYLDIDLEDDADIMVEIP
jgi:hypothetical protein